ncbi:MAG: TonB-dependent receptor [Verrucomicrobiales bacterium]|nr:TonB-dependent receptor [Verrucomicrobiales bacterium]
MKSGLASLLLQCLAALRRTIGLLLLVPALSTFAAATQPIATNDVRIVELSGRVETLFAGQETWVQATHSSVLRPGDQLRTGADSRATLQFSDHSVFRIDQSSLLEIRPSEKPNGWKELFLRFGAIFFLDRERPSPVRISTPTTTSAIRGTEFLLAVNAVDGSTELSMLDGVVDLTANGETLEVITGQRAVALPGQGTQVSPLLLTHRLVQWCLYYPAVLDPEDLSLDPEAHSALAPAIAAYRSGDLPNALANLPRAPDRFGDAATLFAAALKTSVGQISEVERAANLPASPPPVVRALRWLIAVTRQEELPRDASPTTTSEWLGWSYVLQARLDLPGAAQAARQATQLSPNLGHAWIRYAELEWSLGHWRETRSALARGRELSPRSPRIGVLEGYLHWASADIPRARAAFDEARSLDGSVGDAWLGLGLCAAYEGANDEARRLFQIAATLEPQRAVTRSYLGRAFDAARDRVLAEHEFELALRLDSSDPTGWLYRGIHHQQTHALNRSVLDLEESVARNDNRALFRSRLLLDTDRAMRQADLSLSYAETGLSEVAARAASRALEQDYANASAHLMRARALQNLEDPARFDLRWEAPRQNHLLLANLLAPPGAANLSQQLSQQDFYHAGGGLFHGSSLTTYRSSGDWEENATFFGSERRFAYALDGQWQSIHGDRPNAQRELAQASLQLRQNLTDADGLYFQAGILRREGGDPSRLYDPESAIRGYRYHEWQEPALALGYARAWNPGSHTLALVSHVDEHLEVFNPEPEILFLRQHNGQPTSLLVDPFFDSHLDSRFPLTSVELQHILQTDDHVVVAGGGYQAGHLDSRETLTRELSPAAVVTESSPEFSEARGYAYYTFRAWRPLGLTAGVTVQDIVYPRNADWSPVSDESDQRTAVSPKAGVTYTPWSGAVFRGGFAQGIGSQDFASSLRLEPSEIGGFPQTFHGLVPSSAVGVLTGQREQMLSLGYDQRIGQRTFFGVAAEELRSWGEQTLGIMTHAGPAPIPDQTEQRTQRIEFREQALALYASHLIGERWAVGLRYRLAEDHLDRSFPTLPKDLPGTTEFVGARDAVLHDLEGFALFNHECGFYAQWSSRWRGQHSTGGLDTPPDENFWQHDLAVGYRFPYRRADLRIDLLNLFDQDYRLNPLSPYLETPRRRTLQLTLRIHF